MFEGLIEDQLSGALEAMLFVTDEPVGSFALAQMLEVDVASVERELNALRERYETEGRGIQLREVAGGWRLYTHPQFHELIEKYVVSWDTRKLSQAALETLAIVAYAQPVTRAGVASIRGVNSDSSINSLVEKGLIREAGTADTPGNPMLYATTRSFLEKFGLRTVADLPDLSEFAPDEATHRFIAERLSATRLDLSLGAVSNEGVKQPSLLDELTFVDEDEETIDGAANPGSELTFQKLAESSPVSPTDQLLASMMGTSFGVVDKVDFDSLVFESDDE